MAEDIFNEINDTDIITTEIVASDATVIEIDAEESVLTELVTEVDALGNSTPISFVEESVPFEVTVEEFAGASTSTNIVTTHTQSGSDQHTIGAITGLREELDSIKKLQTIYSNSKYQANYFMWHERPANPVGLFVTMCESVDKVRICTSEDDVFGVTVPVAAFIGGQDEEIARDDSYVLVINAGLAAVQCESNVAVGDYVMPNDRGQAQKTDGSHGYLVTGLEILDGVQHAVISLSTSSTISRNTADTISDLGGRMVNAESNIASVGNVANSAYALAKDAKENAQINSKVLEEAITDVLGRMDKIDGEGGIVDNLNQSINNACESAAQAKQIAADAVSAAQQMGDDAYASANEAIAAIKDIGAGSTSWAKRIDAYSVGEYSQAYGLTWEQAKSALHNGLVYIPTKNGEETYIGAEDVYEQVFAKGYYYVWSGEQWVPSASVAVNFSNAYISGSTQAPYWVVTDADVEFNSVIYKLNYLYKWENDGWNTTGISATENTLTRAVSAMHQTANELSMEVSNVIGDVAAIETRVDENESTVQTLTRWTGSEEGKYNIATTKVNADDDGASIALVVVKDGTDEELSGARIILNDGEKGSHIQMDADQINFVSKEFNIYPSDGEGKIDDSEGPNFSVDTNGKVNIKGTIHANAGEIGGCKIEDNVLQIKSANIDGQLTADKIDATGLHAEYIEVLDDNGDIIFRADSENHEVQVNRVTATEGTIGGWQINEDSLMSEDNSVGLFPDPSNDTNCIIWAGNSEQTNAPFQVFKDGTVKIHKGGLQITADGKLVNTLFMSSKDYHYNDIDHENLKYYRYSGTYYGAEGLIGTGYIHRQYAEIGASVTDLINYPDPNTRSTLGIAIADSYKHTSSIVNSYTKFTQINPGVVYIGAYERAFELDDRGNLTSTKLSLDGLTSTSNKFTITTNKLAITSDEIAITATNGQLKGVWTLGNDSKVSSIPTIRYNTAAQNYGDGGAKDLTTAGNNNDEQHPKLCACMVYLNSGKNATITIDDCTSQVVSAMVCEHNAVSDSTINNHKVAWTGKTVTVYNAANGSRRLVLWVLYI